MIKRILRNQINKKLTVARANFFVLSKNFNAVLFGLLVVFTSQCYALEKKNLLLIDEKEWIAKKFGDVRDCGPVQGFYFDKEKWESNDRVLEDKGYTAYAVDDYLAKYRIKEQFFGLPAVEIAIPSATTSIYTVTVAVPANRLAQQIKSVTGKTILKYDGRPAKNGIAYIVSEGNNHSSFVCFSFEEGF